MLLYYITDRGQFPGDARTKRHHLLAKIAEAAHAGVDYIQLRERDLTGGDLEDLATEVLLAIRRAAVQPGKPRPQLLINSRTDVALAVGADGVHLRSHDVSADAARQIWSSCAAAGRAGAAARMTVAVSCHTTAQVRLAQVHGADFAVFAPVFEKSASDAQPAGLAALRDATRASIPVLALGGITLENAASCLEAGAAGIAAIRLFQENDIARVASALRRT
ncbi:MAG TPA: thiamine phosphate synthase [Terriglobales bacterium]|nr:thiamine phosphate synthase [Terriglobales bacterium]